MSYLQFPFTFHWNIFLKLFFSLAYRDISAHVSRFISFRPIPSLFICCSERVGDSCYNVKWAILQLHHGESKIHFDELLFYYFSDPEPTSLGFTSYYYMLRGEATNANFIVFDLIRPEFETHDLLANHYTTVEFFSVVVTSMSQHLKNKTEAFTALSFWH